MRCRLTNLGLFSIVAVTLVALCSSPRVASATPVLLPIFSENFDAGLPGGGFLTGGSGPVVGVSGTAQLTNGPGNLTYYTSSTFGGEQLTFVGDVNQLNGGVGGTANGLTVGNRAYVYFGSFTGGAFNILSLNPASPNSLGTVLGDTNMGYTPAQNNRQHFKIVVTPVLSTFNIDVQISNLDGPGSFTYNYFDAGYVAGSVGFFNWSGSHSTQFDNLQVLALREVPEPSTLALLGLGAIGLAVKTRRRAK